MDSITEYKIVSAPTEAELEDQVNAWIKEGWRPQGGVTDAVFVDSSMLNAGAEQARHFFHQAIVR